MRASASGRVGCDGRDGPTRSPSATTLPLRGRDQTAFAYSQYSSDTILICARIVAAAPGYAGYQAKTDREIPIVRLTPTSA